MIPTNQELKVYYERASVILSKQILNIRYRNNRSAKELIKKNKCPDLTKAEIREIDDYWAQFGIKFADYDFHKMYYGITNIHDPRFIPEPFASLVLYPYYNDASKIFAYADKNMFYKILPEVHFPILLGQRINGRYFSNKKEYFGTKVSMEFVNLLYAAITKVDNEIIIKEASGSSSGRGVKKYSIKSPNDLKNILVNCESKNFVIQFAVKQHSFLSQFNESSVNVIRLTTWRHGNGVSVFSPCLRFGEPGSATDVSFINGIEVINCVGIDESGKLKKFIVGRNGEKRELFLKNYQIPCWDEIVKTAHHAHLELDYFDIVAWDFTIDDSEKVVCIEYNLRSPGTIVYQFAHGPFAGDNTDKLLSFLKLKDMRMKYLPKSIRL